MIFQHHRFQIWNSSQHPYSHNAGDVSYTHPSLPTGTVTTLEGALNWIMAVIYPQTQPSVANPAALPLAGNQINDYRVVLDDGDGKAAGYRWEQREGEVTASWHKIYDMDWGEQSILSNFLVKTQDVYAYKYGHDDVDPSGTPLAGIDAGQSIYGGASANAHLSLFANAGDGTGAQTGFVQVGDDFRPRTNNTRRLGTATERWSHIYGVLATVGTMSLAGGSITDSSGAISFGDETLSTTSTVTAGSLTIGSGSITDTSGTVSFGDENVTTTGTGTFNSVTATGAASSLASGTTVGDLTLANGSITDSSGAISFGNENLSTTGSITGGQVNADNLRLDGNSLTAQNVGGNVNIAANGAGVIDLQSALTSLGQTVTGNIGVTGNVTATGLVRGGNLQLSGNTLSSIDTNGNISLNPNGTGIIQPQASLIPDADAAYALGDTALRYTNLFMSGSIGDGTNTISVGQLLDFRQASVGAALGDALFWDGTKWVASNPDTEIDHGELSGLADDDHAQYALLAGRAGGQSLTGGTAASENLTLASTTNATKGFVVFADALRPGVDNAPASSTGLDVGSGSFRVRDLYISGRAIGLRFENAANVGALPAASANTPGRAAWVTGNNGLYVDTGGTWLRVGAEVFVEDTAWLAAQTQETYDVSGVITDARRAIFALRDASDNYRIMQGADIRATSATAVTVDFGIAPGAGTYRLVGIG
jgi:hypothetical protein